MNLNITNTNRFNLMYKKIMKIKWLIPNHVEYNSAWICMYNVFFKKFNFENILHPIQNYKEFANQQLN